MRSSPSSARVPTSAPRSMPVGVDDTARRASRPRAAASVEAQVAAPRRRARRRTRASASASAAAAASAAACVPSRRMTSTASSATAGGARRRSREAVLPACGTGLCATGSALEHDLQRVRLGGVAERVVRRHRLAEREAVRRERRSGRAGRSAISLSSCRRRERVDEPGRDRHVADPELLEVQRRRVAVDADVRDTAAGADRAPRRARTSRGRRPPRSRRRRRGRRSAP